MNSNISFNSNADTPRLSLYLKFSDQTESFLSSLCIQLQSILTASHFVAVQPKYVVLLPYIEYQNNQRIEIDQLYEIFRQISMDVGNIEGRIIPRCEITPLDPTNGDYLLSLCIQFTNLSSLYGLLMERLQSNMVCHEVHTINIASFKASPEHIQFIKSSLDQFLVDSHQFFEVCFAEYLELVDITRRYSSVSERTVFKLEGRRKVRRSIIKLVDSEQSFQDEIVDGTSERSSMSDITMSEGRRTSLKSKNLSAKNPSIFPLCDDSSLFSSLNGFEKSQLTDNNASQHHMQPNQNQQGNGLLGFGQGLLTNIFSSFSIKSNKPPMPMPIPPYPVATTPPPMPPMPHSTSPAFVSSSSNVESSPIRTSSPLGNYATPPNHYNQWNDHTHVLSNEMYNAYRSGNHDFMGIAGRQRQYSDPILPDQMRYHNNNNLHTPPPIPTRQRVSSFSGAYNGHHRQSPQMYQPQSIQHPYGHAPGVSPSPPPPVQDFYHPPEPIITRTRSISESSKYIDYNSLTSSCPNCNAMIKPDSVTCFVCSHPVGRQHSLSIDSSNMKSKDSPVKSQVGDTIREGDWICSKCSGHNFASKIACFTCHASRPGFENGIPLSQIAMLGLGKLGGSSAEAKPGDWTCPKCNENVFAKRNRCYRCTTSRPRKSSS